MTKFDIKETVTNSIIKAIEEGTAPWRSPWTGSQTGVAFPLRSTGEQYRGINILLLWCAAQKNNYVSAHWFTYKQAADLGAQVRKGEKSSTVVKYGTFDKEINIFPRLKAGDFRRGQPSFQLSLQRRANALPPRP